MTVAGIKMLFLLCSHADGFPRPASGDIGSLVPDRRSLQILFRTPAERMPDAPTFPPSQVAESMNVEMPGWQAPCLLTDGRPHQDCRIHWCRRPHSRTIPSTPSPLLSSAAIQTGCGKSDARQLDPSVPDGELRPTRSTHRQCPPAALRSCLSNRDANFSWLDLRTGPEQCTVPRVPRFFVTETTHRSSLAEQGDSWAVPA